MIRFERVDFLRHEIKFIFLFWWYGGPLAGLECQLDI